MQKLDINKEIYIYLIGNRDFDEGLTILRKYERRKAFINILSNKKRNHASISKLHYALWRLTSLPIGVLHKREKLEEYEKPTPPSNEASGSGSPSASGEKTESGSGSSSVNDSEELDKPESHSDQVIHQMNESKDESDNEPTESDIITRIKAEISEQTVKRSALHKQLKEIGDDNDALSIAQRKATAESIAQVSARIDFLFITKEDYFKDGLIPSEELVFPKPIKTPKTKKLSIPELMKREKNLISSLTKDKAKLLYQSQKKEEEENPMPAGPKRDAVAKRVKEKTAELKQVRELLKNAN